MRDANEATMAEQTRRHRGERDEKLVINQMYWNAHYYLAYSRDLEAEFVTNENERSRLTGASKSVQLKSSPHNFDNLRI